MFSKKTFIFGLLIIAVMVALGWALAIENYNKESSQLSYPNYHLASIINAECGNCTEEEKYMVGSTVLNRADVNNQDILQILSEENQYKGYLSEQYYCTLENDIIATNLLFGIKRNYDVKHFYKGDPKWDDTMTVLKFPDFKHKFAF